ncbi:MAG TPA: response regulator [Planctomycetota bacterium]|nr:response regulator [Planctomycetota bacterium]
MLVAQHDGTVSSRIEAEIAGAGMRVAGPVRDLASALARAERQEVAAVLLDLHLPDGGGAAAGRFLASHPHLPVIATVPRKAEEEGRAALAAGARTYLLDEEIGRGLLAPLVRHVAGARDGPVPAEAAAARRLLHDLSNLLAVVGGEAEMLAERADSENPLAEDIRGLHEAVKECLGTFRSFVALRKGDAT